MTHVLRLSVENGSQHDELEKLLIKTANPPMNVVHKAQPVLGPFGFQVRRYARRGVATKGATAPPFSCASKTCARLSRRLGLACHFTKGSGRI